MNFGWVLARLGCGYEYIHTGENGISNLGYDLLEIYEDMDF